MNRRDIIAASLVSLAVAGGAVGRLSLRQGNATGHAAEPVAKEPSSEEMAPLANAWGERVPSSVRVAPAIASTAAPSSAPVAPHLSNRASRGSASRDRERESKGPAEVHKVSAGRWISEYRQAVCECSTRACVRDVQGRFLTSRVDYEAQRDDEAYTEGARAALRCYFALPEGS